MPSKGETFLDEVRRAEVRTKRVSHPSITDPLVHLLLFSHAYSTWESLDEAARCSGGCDDEEGSGGKIKETKTVLSRLSEPSTLALCAHICPPMSHLSLKYTWNERRMALNLLLFGSSGSIILFNNKDFLAK